MSSATSWKKLCTEGRKSFRDRDIDGALKSFDEAIRLANDKSYVPYDTRADVYEKLNCFNYALRDAKKIIDIAPRQWQGYFRSTRLLAALGQSEAALQMCSRALLHLGYGPKYESHRRELTDLLELLLAIFKHSSNPVIISHVCHRWRDVTHSNSTLWSSLVLTGPPERALRKIQEWDERSRGQIVQLSIRESLAEALFPFDVFNPRGHCAMYTEIVATLRHLDLTKLKELHTEELYAELFLSALSDGTRSVHQQLEALSTSNPSPRVNALGRPAYNKLPWENLRVLSIKNVWCYWEQLSTSMHHLTSFEYKVRYNEDYEGFPYFHQFLQANAGLEKLVLEIVIDLSEAPNDSFFTPRESLTLAHLRHLELKGTLPFYIADGKCFRLPSLRILRITWLEDAAQMLSRLMEDEGTSFAGLVELTTRARLLGRRVLTSLLLRTPKLEILNSTDLDSVVAESLTKPCTALLRDPASEDPKLVPTELPILCPALSLLDLSRSPRLKTDPVMQIVKERIALAASQDGGRYQLPGEEGDRGVSCIRTLNVDGCPHIEAKMLPWFQENVPEFSCRHDVKRKTRRSR
ncbi:hypothetical protein EDB85DRAFT_1972333 [Lactarius pseudohatsudake]|nr:hypothetical protein EDB85DRAFT_1972333 [Lactarius pseudohatsudake]